jgi:hypothetical protein
MSVTPAAIQIRVFAGGPIIGESVRGPNANRRVGHAFYPNRRIAMLKPNAAVCSRRRYRRVWRQYLRSIGLYIDNDRQHGLRLHYVDQQTLCVQFAPGPQLIGVDVVVAGDSGNRGTGFKRLLNDRSFPFQWMPSVLAPNG